MAAIIKNDKEKTWVFQIFSAGVELPEMDMCLPDTTYRSKGTTHFWNAESKWPVKKEVLSQEELQPFNRKYKPVFSLSLFGQLTVPSQVISHKEKY